MLMITNLSVERFVYNLFMRVGYVSGTKNSEALRSGIPISHKVGPLLGGSYMRTPMLITEPTVKYINLSVDHLIISKFTFSTLEILKRRLSISKIQISDKKED